ncbi:uncharacterized protein VTP21DRAFT_10788 [Calcarisporiella thermophila]|uniref:uncharacterized protein n=1 Tax=Calcarisporiella thermophila TaxID=911321 RepID=UPI00374310F6
MPLSSLLPRPSFVSICFIFFSFLCWICLLRIRFFQTWSTAVSADACGAPEPIPRGNKQCLPNKFMGTKCSNGKGFKLAPQRLHHVTLGNRLCQILNNAGKIPSPKLTLGVGSREAAGLEFDAGKEANQWDGSSGTSTRDRLHK